MKVLFVITGLGMGGAENLVVNLADYFKLHGHQVIIAYAFGDVVVKPRSDEIPVISLGVKSYRDFFLGYLNLRKVINDFKPDVVHSHMIHANLLSRLVRVTTTIPRLICTAHSTNEGGRLRMLIYRMTNFLNDVFTNVSDDAVSKFISLGAAKVGQIISVPNGVDTNKFHFDIRCCNDLPRANGEKYIIAVGRLSAAKDYANLITAMSLVVLNNNKVKLKIVGDGELKKELHDLVVKLKLEENIDFLGVRHDIPQLMSASDLFVLSSAYEGFGLVVAEAMACELPVVATDCGGVKEVVGECGWLVEPKNPELLAHAVLNVLSLSHEQRIFFCKKSRERVIDKFSLDRTAKKYLSLYKGDK